MLISCIIPAKNSEKFIERCLNSIFRQDVNDFEIIVIDDRSEDNTKLIIEEYQKLHENLKYVYCDSKGVSAARNMGLKVAKGDYIIFIDSDDEIEVGLFSTILPYMTKGFDGIKYNAKYVGGNFDSNDDRFICSSFDSLSGEDALARFCQEEKIFATPWMYAIKKSIYLNNKLFFPEGIAHEDVAVIPLAIFYCEKFVSIDFIGYKYIQHKKSIMNDRSYKSLVKRAYDFLVCYDFLHYRFDNEQISKKNKDIFYNYLSKRINCKILQLQAEDKEKYIELLNKRKVNSWILDDEKIAKKYR